jgi:hypothetical protein
LPWQYDVFQYPDVPTSHVKMPRYGITCRPAQLHDHVSQFLDVPTSRALVLRCADVMCHSTRTCRHFVSEHSDVPGIMCHSTLMWCHYVIVPIRADIMCQSTQICRHHVSLCPGVPKSRIEVPKCVTLTSGSIQMCRHSDVPTFPRKRLERYTI